MAGVPQFRRIIPLSHGISEPDTQQAVRQLEHAIAELQTLLSSYIPTRTSFGGGSTTTLASGVVIVDYKATGAEGVDFFVPIGLAMTTASYGVVWAPRGVTAVPVVDLPNGTGDRTTTKFRVLMNAQIAAGDFVTFILFQR